MSGTAQQVLGLAAGRGAIEGPPVSWDEALALPVILGGPGFAVPGFDTDLDAEDLLAQLLARYPFLDGVDPDRDLEILEDRWDPPTRTIVARQVIDGVPVYQSRLHFVFTVHGEFLAFSGRFVSDPDLRSVERIESCDDFVGTLDDWDETIVDCEPFWYLPDREIPAPDWATAGLDDGQVLLPVLRVTSLSEDGEAHTSWFSETDGAFHRPRWYDSPGHRKVQKYYRFLSFGFWRDVFEDDECLWSTYCSDPDFQRLRDALDTHANNMAWWHHRLSWNGSGDDWRARIHATSTGHWSNSDHSAHLDETTRQMVLTHEFTHGLLNDEAPGLHPGLAEGLCDAYGIIIMQETDHWCYHNYPGWSEEVCSGNVPFDPNDTTSLATHIRHARCTMLARDTPGERPHWDRGDDDSAPPPPYEPRIPGILFNVHTAPHMAGQVFTKVFELFQRDQWVDPVLGPQTHFNGITLSGSYSFYQVARVFYRLVTNYLSGVDPTLPWTNFDRAFILALQDA